MLEARECPACGTMVADEVDPAPGRLTANFECDTCGCIFTVPVVEWDEDFDPFEPMKHHKKKKTDE